MNTYDEIQRHARKVMETLPSTLRYGLKISATNQSEDKPEFSGSVRHGKIQHGGKLSDLRTALENPKKRETFLRCVELSPWKHAIFAQMFAEARNSFSLEISDGESSRLELTSTYEENASDVLFITVQKNGSLSLYEKNGGNTLFAGRTVFVHLEESARMNVIRLQNVSRHTHFYSHVVSSLSPDARISWVDFHAGGNFVKSDIEDNLIGEDAESAITVLALAGNQEFDFYHSARHKAPNTRSRIVTRGILGAKSKIISRGAVNIEKDIIGANGYQDGKFILSANDAEIDAIPALDIGSPRVIARHSLSINYLPRITFYYPMLRGIPPAVAQTLIMEGFLLKELGVNDAIEIRTLLHEKLSSKAFHD